MRPISTAQLEYTLPILAELDLEPLLGLLAGLGPVALGEDGKVNLTEVKLTPGLLTGLAPLLLTLGKAGQARLLRRLAAVARATDDELEAADGKPGTLKALEAAAARRPFLDNLMEVVAFFRRAGLSASPTPASSETGGAEAKPDQAEPPQAASPSVVS